MVNVLASFQKKQGISQGGAFLQHVGCAQDREAGAHLTQSHCHATSALPTSLHDGYCVLPQPP